MVENVDSTGVGVYQVEELIYTEVTRPDEYNYADVIASLSLISHHSGL